MSYRTPLTLLSPNDADAEAAERLQGAKKALGFVPNMYAAMANAPGLLATYMDGYQRFRSGSGLTPAEQEVVFLTISRFNECHYCVAAHSVVADRMSGTPPAVTNAIRDDQPIGDARMAALSRMTRVLLETRGRPPTAEVDAFVAAGYTHRQVLELVLAIAVKTLSNWTNHLFETPVDDLFATRSWQPR